MLIPNRSRRRGDDGAVAVMVTIFFAALVLFAMGALTIDTGQFYAEKNQLQNGADAAAVAVAKTCVANPASQGCDAHTGPGYTASNYANSNANDNASTVEQVCGNGPGLTPCSPHSNLCPSSQPSNSVDVQTSTLQSDGTKALPAFFGEALLGAKYNGQIHACAQARWGSPGPTNGIALTVSYCAWKQSVGDPTQPSYPTAPPYPPYPSASYEHLFYFHGNTPGTDTQDQSCVTPNSSGSQVPGGFGHTCELGASNCANTGTMCQTNFSTYPNNWYGSNTGNSVDSLCTDALYNAWLSHSYVLLPVFDCVSSVPTCLQAFPCAQCGTAGNNAAYHLQSLGAFVITAYHFQSSNQTQLSWLPGSQYATATPCRGNNSCIVGFFTTASDNGGDPGPGPSYGVTSVKLSG